MKDQLIKDIESIRERLCKINGWIAVAVCQMCGAMICMIQQMGDKGRIS